VPTSTVPYVEWLGQAEGGIGALGGKGGSLDRLIRLGFRVPPGFCLTTAAFERQLASIPEAAGLIERLPDDEARAALEAAVSSSALDPEVEAALGTALAQFAASAKWTGPIVFAVRSSGVGEDGTEASYAGLHETELGVAPADVGAAARRCWASLWSAPAMFYRKRRGLAAGGGAMAVVVQRLVPAEAAAVVFTRHPVTGRDDQIVVTAVRGLGDAMVSGTVTPETLVVDRSTGAVVERTLGEDGRPALDGPRLDELVELARRVETEYGLGVDLEAAIGDGGWFLLQARPITV
jgi:pyruvate,water dikinase